jgi:hypothetical protein
MYNDAKALEKNNLCCGCSAIICPIISAASHESPAPVKFFTMIFFKVSAKNTSFPSEQAEPYRVCKSINTLKLYANSLIASFIFFSPYFLFKIKFWRFSS